jgi:hypothetical protein
MSASGFPGNREDPYLEGIMATNLGVIVMLVYPAKIANVSQINVKFVAPNLLLIAWIHKRLSNASASSGMLPD